MTKEPACIRPLMTAGLGYYEAHALRRIAMQLHRWHELECGTDQGAVERDEKTGKTYFYHAMTGRCWLTRDMETGALKRLRKLMSAPGPTAAKLSYYVQGDPRGAALYVLRPGDVPQDGSPDAYYNRGIAVYR